VFFALTGRAAEEAAPEDNGQAAADGDGQGGRE
jgi:hypothetical protein